MYIGSDFAPNFLMAESQGIAAAASVVDLIVNGFNNYLTDLELEPKKKAYTAISTCFLMCKLVGVS